jgi:hypothetical protein
VTAQVRVQLLCEVNLSRFAIDSEIGVSLQDLIQPKVTYLRAVLADQLQYIMFASQCTTDFHSLNTGLLSRPYSCKCGCVRGGLQTRRSAANDSWGDSCNEAQAVLPFDARNTYDAGKAPPCGIVALCLVQISCTVLCCPTLILTKHARPSDGSWLSR